MTKLHPDEAKFQAAIDACVEDMTARAVFADWLDERGDPRGPGYREMAARGVRAVKSGSSPVRWYAGRTDNNNHNNPASPTRFSPCLIDPEELARIPMGSEKHCGWWADRPTRRKMEDAMALAISLEVAHVG